LSYNKLFYHSHQLPKCQIKKTLKKKREAQRFGVKMIRKMLLAMLLCVHAVAASHTAAVGSLLGAASLRVAGQVFPNKCI